MGNLQVPNGGNGGIEVYGASTKLTEELLSNFSQRGQDAARLAVATLTESPYTPVIEGARFEIEVSNRYKGGGQDAPEGPDTVIEAREALREFLTSDVPGARPLKLLSLKTQYEKMLRNLTPSRRDTSGQRNAFNEALVEKLRQEGVQVASPEQGLLIVRGAPKWLSLLKLSNHQGTSISIASNMAVTVDGHMVTTHNHKPVFSGYSDFLSADVSDRGGSAPGSTIVSQIERQILQLRTGHTKR